MAAKSWCKDTSDREYENLPTQTVSNSSSTKESDLSIQFSKLNVSFQSSKDREDTLSTLKRIFDNIIQYPNDEKYRQIKLTSKTFTSKVWRYPAGQQLMKMSGWVLEGDHVTLRDESFTEAVSKLLEQRCAKSPEVTLDVNRSNTTDVCSSSKCCSLSSDEAKCIMGAIQPASGIRLKELLSPYHANCVNNMQVTAVHSIISFVFMVREIGIARILVNEYGVDVNSIDRNGDPDFFMLFEGCDSTESCQSLIIRFIKEFKINVNRQSYMTALHFAMLHKLFAVVKFLVEDCKVDVNCVSSSTKGGTPLHMAYGIGEESIAQYLIKHGADQDAMDDTGRKPREYKFYEDSDNVYLFSSNFFKKRRLIMKTFGSPEFNYYMQMFIQGISDIEAVDLTIAKFPSLQKQFPDLANWRDLEVTPTLNELNHYITDMAPSYYNIGLELDIVNRKLKVIQSDPGLPDLERKCHKMLEVWLESDTSATWKKLCNALQEVGMSVLAEQIKGAQ